MLETIGSALIHLLSGWHLLYMMIGVLVGLVVGILPGLGGIAGMILAIPLTAFLVVFWRLARGSIRDLV